MERLRGKPGDADPVSVGIDAYRALRPEPNQVSRQRAQTAAGIEAYAPAIALGRPFAARTSRSRIR